MGTEPDGRQGSVVMGTPAILAAEMMESGGLSWGNTSFAAIASIKSLTIKQSRNLQIAEKHCEPMHMFQVTYLSFPFQEHQM